MALSLEGGPSLGAYYCLIRRRFKRRRKKRSERKGIATVCVCVCVCYELLDEKIGVNYFLC